MGRLLEVKNLNISFSSYAGKIHAVRDISFDVQSGKTLAIVGESGCGKTVTAKSIIGLIQNNKRNEITGEIWMKDKELLHISQKEWNKYRGKEIGMIFQDALVSLNPTMTIGKQIMEGMLNHSKLSKKERYKRMIEMLNMVSIPNPEQCIKRYPHELSGGMRQRVMIASVLVMHPDVLIADEPTTALDVTIQAQILKILKKIQKDFHMSIILITHDLGIVADAADDIIIMYAGKIIERGTCEEIFYDPKHPYTWGLLHAVPSLGLDKNVELFTIEGGVPNMLNPPKGCAFCDRCKCAMKICQNNLPPEYVITETHKVNCWLQEEYVSSNDIPFI